ncbi:50S ribosomal protein L3 [Dehalococcoides mccartyi]|uniref:Large ribosomal subunit protein uL3 n=1 Tax=Dehalococcoides mccartyi (strain VS) TaxID=311424 RepID=D2BGX2_DEHMV|nr:50S ribosomal protein L3 [Dehalococcoides mccartyi]ACZ61572.1 ribosomal protein L3 [Dehalococcoides mccartyi VS]
MIQGIIGKKIGMTQIFQEDGKAQPVTLVEAGPCVVVQVKTEKQDGYEAVQLGYGKAKHITSAVKGQCRGFGEFKVLREVDVDDIATVNVGDQITVSDFKDGEKIDASGVSRGRGFAGVVKRWHFAGGPKTHGQSDRHRAPGSISSTTTPGRIYKGKRMAGHMGNDAVTIRNLVVLKTDAEKNLLMVKGAIPGGKNTIILIKKTGK